ncbi:MAG: hypothetical protein LWW77_02120 [Propionibacteriales bacterium]|nr:hypothetical protein [Propionibacteriales bacterium]
MSGLHGTTRGHRHVAASPIVAAVLGSLLFAFSLSPAFAATTSQWQQYLAAGAATLSFQESTADGQAACTSSTLPDSTAASCSGIDLYGGRNLQPGAMSSTTVVFTNSGTGAAHTFTANGGACTQSPTGPGSGTAIDLCEKFQVRISADGSVVFDGTAAEFARTGTLPLVDGDAAIPAGGSVAVTVSVRLSDDIDNSYAGLRIGQPVTWTFQG